MGQGNPAPSLKWEIGMNTFLLALAAATTPAMILSFWVHEPWEKFYIWIARSAVFTFVIGCSLWSLAALFKCMECI
jgi:hypothetical protein